MENMNGWWGGLMRTIEGRGVNDEGAAPKPPPTKLPAFYLYYSEASLGEIELWNA